MLLQSKEQGVSCKPCAWGALPVYNMPQSWAGTWALCNRREVEWSPDPYIVLWPEAVLLPKAGLPQQKEFFSKVCECVWHRLRLLRGRLPSIWHFIIQSLMYAKIIKISIINLKALLASSCWRDDKSKLFSVLIFITIPCENNHCIWTVNTSVQHCWVCHFQSTSQWQQ